MKAKKQPEFDDDVPYGWLDIDDPVRWEMECRDFARKCMEDFRKICFTDAAELEALREKAKTVGLTHDDIDTCRIISDKFFNYFQTKWAGTRGSEIGKAFEHKLLNDDGIYLALSMRRKRLEDEKIYSWWDGKRHKMGEPYEPN